MILWEALTNLTNDEVEELYKYEVFELELKVALLIGQNRFDKYVKCGAIVDCFCNIFLHCKDNSLSTVQLVWLLKLQGTLLKNCAEGMQLGQNLEAMQNFLSCSPSPNDVMSTKNIISYLLQSFFQHYDLYRYMFIASQKHIRLSAMVEVETISNEPTYPPPLEESVLESLYEEYLNPKHKEETMEKEPCEDLDLGATTQEDELVEKEITVSQLISTMKPEELKKLIKDVAETKFNSLKHELEGKIIDREAALSKTFSKLQAQ